MSKEVPSFCKCGHSEWHHHSFNHSCLRCDCDRFTARDHQQHNATEFQDAAYYLVGAREGEQPTSFVPIEDQIELAKDDRVKEQEWTPEYVLSLVQTGNDDEMTTRIADAHNTSLAAMKEECADVMDRHEQQLAQQLAAEREKCSRMEVERDLARDGRKSFYNELLAAQAAIAEHNIRTKDFMTTFGAKLSIDTIDLSSLDKHDEAVRKPLVDALRRLHYAEDGTVIAWPSEEDVTDALAKAKEGK